MARKNNGSKYKGPDGSIFGSTRRKNPNWDYQSQFYGQTQAQREAALKNLEKANAARRKKKRLEKAKEVYEALKNAIETARSMSGVDKRDGPIKALHRTFGIDGDYETFNDIGLGGYDSDDVAAMGMITQMYTKEELKKLGVTSPEELGDLYTEIQRLEAEIDSLDLTDDEIDEIMGFSGKK